MVHSVMVFYGLALALIAVNVFETYADVSKIISQEATSLAMLYRDVSTYPEPIRSQLQKSCVIMSNNHPRSLARTAARPGSDSWE